MYYYVQMHALEVIGITHEFVKLNGKKKHFA